jgi:hypothetical protein
MSGCHAPASAPIPLELREKMVRIVDKAMDVSRAGFERGVREIVRKFGETWVGAVGCHAPASAEKPA